MRMGNNAMQAIHVSRFKIICILAAFGIGGGCLLAIWLTPVIAQPQGRHCGGVGPLPFGDYCGCTWGTVLFHGQPVRGATVTLSLGSASLSTVTALDQESYPTFGFEGYDSGVRLNSIVTLTSAYDGKVISRTFRAAPDLGNPEVEQQVNLVIPNNEKWMPFVSAVSITTVRVISGQVWMGGAAGLVHRDVNGGALVSESTGLDSDVAAIAQDTHGRIWALARYNETALLMDGGWVTMTTGLVGRQRTMAVARDGIVWAGGDSGLSRYDGSSWQPQPDFNGSLSNVTMGLLGATDGSLWVATWGGGVARRAPDGVWTIFTHGASGLSSNRVADVAEADAGIWFALNDGSLPSIEQGGLSFYDLVLDTWQTFTQTHGLPARNMRAVSVDSHGRVWASGVDTSGNGQGIARSIIGSQPLSFTPYTTTDGLSAMLVSDLDAGEHIFAATAAGSDEFIETDTPVDIPSAEIQMIAPASVTLGVLPVQMAGQGADNTGHRVVGYEWIGPQQAPLCTSAACSVDSRLLSLGLYTITFRAQNDIGAWSAPVTQTITVASSLHVFIPVSMR